MRERVIVLTLFSQSIIHLTADLEDSSSSTFKSDIKLKY